MECKRCKEHPNYHSFEFVTRTPAGEGIFYTCPAKGKQHVMKEESIPDYIAHMDKASVSSWIWVFDCSGLQTQHMPSARVLELFTNLVQERYKFVLKTIYFVNMNWKMEMILSLAKPFFREDTKKRMKVLSSRLELLSTDYGMEILQVINK